MNKKSIARNSLAQIIMILTSVMIIFPLYFMTINSFKTREQYLVDPVGLPNPFYPAELCGRLRRERIFCFGLPIASSFPWGLLH